MRLYTITNMYLSSIQCGIQTAHLVHELFNNYQRQDSIAACTLREWSTSHKTIIVLNGGYSSELENLRDEIFSHEDNPYPWASFNEEQDALNGALTVVGIVLPEYVYSTSAWLRDQREHQTRFDITSQLGVTLSEWEFIMAYRLTTYSLAR